MANLTCASRKYSSPLFKKNMGSKGERAMIYEILHKNEILKKCHSFHKFNILIVYKPPSPRLRVAPF